MDGKLAAFENKHLNFATVDASLQQLFMSLGKIIKIIHFDFLYKRHFWSYTIYSITAVEFSLQWVASTICSQLSALDLLSSLCAAEFMYRTVVWPRCCSGRKENLESGFDQQLLISCALGSRHMSVICSCAFANSHLQALFCLYLPPLGSADRLKVLNTPASKLMTLSPCLLPQIYIHKPLCSHWIFFCS